jgi:hypothetical protein
MDMQVKSKAIKEVSSNDILMPNNGNTIICPMIATPTPITQFRIDSIKLVPRRCFILSP